MDFKRLVKRVIAKSNRWQSIYQPSFRKDLNQFTSMEKDNVKRFSIDQADFIPCMDDKTTVTHFDHHYIYHPAWAIRKVREIDPSVHIDIGSILYFSTMLSASHQVQFYDYRPAAVILDGLKTGSEDLCALSFADKSIASISCMHTVEHVGLGRYGDPIDPDGDLKAMHELQRVIAPGGSLLFVTPVGKPKICFNAHRIYSFEQIISYFPELELAEFSLIPDTGQTTGMIMNADPALVKAQEYGCGCFHFTRKK